VPGQVVDEPTRAYLEALGTPEIHGYRHQQGLRVFREEVLSAEPPALAEETVGGHHEARGGAALRPCSKAGADR
jgi:hypothetical protein